MTLNEKQTIKKFEFQQLNYNENFQLQSENLSSYASNILQNGKNTRTEKYIDMTVVSPDSNDCERIFE